MAELVGKANLGGYLMQVDSEQTGESVDVPQEPVEEGAALTDHVQQQALTLSLSGLWIRPTPERVERLVSIMTKFMKEGRRMTYQGRRIYTNMIIESFDYDTDATVANGYRFKMDLIQVRIASPSYQNVPLLVKTQIKPETNGGQKQTAGQNQGAVYHLIKKGDTFWALAPKYGTTVQAVQKLNPGQDPRKLQIGQKVRMK